jgi:G3E family GTPase
LSGDVPRIPVCVITGFLGSGKTTLLSRLLAHAQMRRTAVLVNELGEIGIDDVLLRRVAENVVLLESGCICCTVGEDLTRRLLELLGHRDAGAIPPFDRAIIETTGVADPAPVLQNFMSGPLAVAPFRMAGLTTTVDAVNGITQLDAHTEAVKQVALADRLLVTKTDLAQPPAVDALVARVRRINPGAPLYPIAHGQIEPDRIVDAGLWNAGTRRIDIDAWLNTRTLGERAYTPRAPPHGGSSASAQERHDSSVATHCLVRAAPVRLESLTDALERLIARCGDGLLRTKGVFNVEGAAGPVVVQGVQRVFYPLVHLPSWPSDDRRSRLVVITRNVARPVVDAELSALDCRQ